MSKESYLTENRIERLKAVIRKRQFDITVVLENIHDAHNISAIMRSCDAAGIHEIHAIVTDPRIDLEKYQMHNKITSGSGKWVEILIHESVEDCVRALRPKYETILGTHLSSSAISLYDVDFTSSVALVFGNEHAGISKEMLSNLDGNFIIPQYGMVQSLNISVACAITVYEALRQKEKLGKFEEDNWNENHELLYKRYVKNSKNKLNPDIPKEPLKQITDK